jgi:RNA polymerase sigma-70 factor (ECF subfamily)
MVMESASAIEKSVTSCDGRPFREAQPARDDSILVALRAGVPDAARALWIRFTPLVFWILRRVMGTGSDIEDLAQDVFLTIFERIHRLRDPNALGAFVASVARFTARNKHRDRAVSRRRDRQIREVLLDHVISTDVEGREGLNRLATILIRLHPKERSVFALRFVEGMKLSDIALALGSSLATIKRRARRARIRVVTLAGRDPVLGSYVMRLRSSEYAVGARDRARLRTSSEPG